MEKNSRQAPAAASQPLVGFLNIDKPGGMTAHDVVAAVRKALAIRQVGHAGTLDPMATGVLPVAVGKATRLIRYLSGDKTYLADIRLGMTTTTDDIEGETLSTSDDLPQARAVLDALPRFVGTLTQVPPAYSAVHHQGERLYALARRGQLPDKIPARTVTVHSIEAVDVSPPVVRVRISCSTGTYIRSVARDLGENLGCGGCLERLIREESGPFRLQESVTLEALKAAAAAGKQSALLVSPATALDMPVLVVTPDEARRIAHGQTIEHPGPAVAALPDRMFVTCDDTLVAVCAACGDGRLKPEVVLASAD